MIQSLSNFSSFEMYLFAIPAIMLGSILFLGGIVLLLEPRNKSDAETLAEIRKALERRGDELANDTRPGTAGMGCCSSAKLARASSLSMISFTLPNGAEFSFPVECVE